MNLLAQALTLLRPATVRLYRNTGRNTNAAGLDVPTFAPGLTITDGHVQAVRLSAYKDLGLDLTKRYVTWHVSASVVSVSRDRGADEFEWNGKRYSVTGEADWMAYDGWCALIGQEIGAATNA